MNTLTIVFIGLAAFIIWRLYSVLGTRTGNERPHTDYLPDQRQNKPQQDNRPFPHDIKDKPETDNIHPDLIDDEVRFPWGGYAEEGSELAKNFDKIVTEDKNFHPRSFVEGAKMAYEMIVTSFAKGDKKTLKPLLSDKVYEGFETAIDAAKDSGNETEMTFVGMKQAKIIEADIEEGEIIVTVKFSSENISATYNQEGTLIDGNPNEVTTVVDIWTFARPVGSQRPEWYLIATRS